MMITKVNLNCPFSKAGLLAATPSNMISAFKTCGVYPFNPNDIDSVVCSQEVLEGHLPAVEAEPETSISSNPSASFTDNHIKSLR